MKFSLFFETKTLKDLQIEHSTSIGFDLVTWICNSGKMSSSKSCNYFLFIQANRWSLLDKTNSPTRPGSVSAFMVVSLNLPWMQEDTEYNQPGFLSKKTLSSEQLQPTRYVDGRTQVLYQCLTLSTRKNYQDIASVILSALRKHPPLCHEYLPLPKGY